MKEIQLSQGKCAKVDDEDYDWLSQWSWHYVRAGYAFRFEKINGKWCHIGMHRQIMATPKGLEVDHINGDTLDNQRLNLRNCSHRENLQNQKQRKDTSSIYKGVYWDKTRNKWVLRLNHKFIGRFESERHAAMAYDLWAIDMFGKFARTNFERVGGSRLRLPLC